MQNGPAYCEAFLNVLRNVTKEEAVQYVLALIDDMLSGMPCCACEPIWHVYKVSSADQNPPSRHEACVATPAVDPSRAQLFHQESELHLANLPDPYSIFLRYASDSQIPNQLMLHLHTASAVLWNTGRTAHLSYWLPLQVA